MMGKALGCELSFLHLPRQDESQMLLGRSECRVNVRKEKNKSNNNKKKNPDVKTLYPIGVPCIKMNVLPSC